MTGTNKYKFAIIKKKLSKGARLIFFCFILFFALSAIFFLSTFVVRPHIKDDPNIRRFPYPYQAALTLNSDIDGTDTRSEFLTIQEYINTRNETPLGPGLGLEIGNSIFPRAPYGRFALFSDDPRDFQVISELIKRGWIDAIHSFNLDTDRDTIRGIIEDMDAAGLHFPVWVNHSEVFSDIGPYPYDHGDDESSPSYHTDFSVPTIGYRYSWLRECTTIIGQGRTLSISDFFAPWDKTHPLPSLKNVVIKGLLKFTLSPHWAKYQHWWTNELVWPEVLDDGTRIFSYVRTDVSPNGIGPDAKMTGLSLTLRPDVLRTLISNGGLMIIYTHFGANPGSPYFTKDAIKALSLLSKANSEGSAFVATTSRLLQYWVNRRYLDYEIIQGPIGDEIHINGINDPVRGQFIPTREELLGLTFYLQSPGDATIYLDNQILSGTVGNPPDQTGKPSISIPWEPLPSPDSLYEKFHQLGYFEPYPSTEK